jgi:hypothetical protein
MKSFTGRYRIGVSLYYKPKQSVWFTGNPVRLLSNAAQPRKARQRLFFLYPRCISGKIIITSKENKRFARINYLVKCKIRHVSFPFNFFHDVSLYNKPKT